MLTHGSLIFIGVLRIYNVLYFLLLGDLSIFLIVFSGLLSAKWAVVYNTTEPALEVLCSSKLNFQFLEVNFQNKRTVSYAPFRFRPLHYSFDVSMLCGDLYRSSYYLEQVVIHRPQSDSYHSS